MFPIVAANGAANTGYNLTRSLRFRASASAYLSRTPASAPTAGTKYTLSMWVKLGTEAASTGVNNTIFEAGTSGNNFSNILFYNGVIYWNSYFQNPGVNPPFRLVTNQVFRDPSAWYHLMFVMDTTQSTASNRLLMYVNGVQVTSFAITNYPSQNSTSYVNAQSVPQWICNGYQSGYGYWDGYLAEFNLIDGQALTPSSFGSTNATTGVWQPAKYTGTYGTNGFYLPFTDNSALTTSSNVGLGKDFSGNGNYWTTNNISLTAGVTYDSMTDVPTLTSATAANYCVLNPIGQGYPGDALLSISNGNLTGYASGVASRLGSFGVSSGKYYYEFNKTAGTGNINVGFAGVNGSTNIVIFQMGVTGGGIIVNGTYVQTFGGLTGNFAVAFDATNLTFSVYNNNSLVGTTVTTGITAGTYTPLVGCGGAGATIEVNFGQRPFTYTPPSGFVALNTYNLPDSTIKQGNKNFDVKLNTGSGAAGSITGIGFKPDLIWPKVRNVTLDHALVDSVRGGSNLLVPNSNAAETTSAQNVTSFNSDGFSFGTATPFANNANMVYWLWKAGQGSNTSNTAGSITSTVSVNAAAGFSIVAYNGTGANATVGHGLGVTPAFGIIKSRSGSATNWMVWHQAFSGLQYLFLNNTNAAGSYASVWNSTVPTSSVFSLGSDGNANASGSQNIGYFWAEIPGFSKFGSYSGNGSADGPFVYLGFRPKYFLFKRTDAAGNDWGVYDSVRDPYNGAQNRLYPDTSGAESTDAEIDFLSNGFKIRSTTAGYNASGGTFIYAAFAENPMKYALAR